jgi:hypothetical protein
MEVFPDMRNFLVDGFCLIFKPHIMSFLTKTSNKITQLLLKTNFLTIFFQ